MNASAPFSRFISAPRLRPAWWKLAGQIGGSVVHPLCRECGWDSCALVGLAHQRDPGTSSTRIALSDLTSHMAGVRVIGFGDRMVAAAWLHTGGVARGSGGGRKIRYR